MEKNIKTTLNGNVLEVKNITKGECKDFEEYSSYGLSTPIFTAELHFNGLKVADVSNDGFGMNPDITYVNGANKASIREFVKEVKKVVVSAHNTPSGGYVEDRIDSLEYLILLMVNESLASGRTEFNIKNIDYD